MAGLPFVRKFPGLAALVGLELFLFLVVSYQVQVNQRLSLLEKMALNVFGPLQELNNLAVGSVSKYLEHKKTRNELLEENIQLRQALAGYERLKSQYVETELENEQFRRLLELPSEDSWRLVHARVIGHSHRHHDYMITINKGSGKDIHRDYGVIDKDGVVGVVWETAGGYAKVMTVNNPNLVVAALVQNTRYQESFVSGHGANRARLNNFPNFENIKPHDLILTSGLDGIFPKGIPIGEVTTSKPSSYMFQEVDLRLVSDFSRLEFVTVLVPGCEADAYEVE